MLTFAQYLEESSLNSDQIIKNPSLMKLGVYAKKGIKLRYYQHHKDIYIGNAHYMQHGNMADMIGAGRDHWQQEALTGFIYPKDYADIKTQTFKGWVTKRHADLKATGKDAYGAPDVWYGGRYIPDPGDSDNYDAGVAAAKAMDTDDEDGEEVIYPTPAWAIEIKRKEEARKAAAKAKLDSIMNTKNSLLNVKVSAHNRDHSHVKSYFRKRPQMSMSFRSR